MSGFPNVPNHPGVPALKRAANADIAANPALSIGLGAAEDLLISALQQPPTWGIFDAIDNSQLGISPNSQSVLQAIGSSLLSQVTGAQATVLSTFSVEFMREVTVADFPIEEGGFKSYNKPQRPGNPVVTLILDGSENDRTYFLSAIDAACISTNLYNVVTPEYIYTNYTIERYRYARTATKGATLLIVEVSLKEIRQATATFATVPIVSPQNAASTPQEQNGLTQPSTPDTSTLNALSKGIRTNSASFFNGGH